MSQFHVFDVAPNTQISWTEYFQSFDGHEERQHLQGRAFDNAVFSVEKLLRDGTTSNRVKEMDAFFNAMRDVRPRILSNGLPWGGFLPMMRNKHASISEGTPFLEPQEEENTIPWIELSRDGTFSNTTLSKITPLNFEVSDDWIELLEKSAREFGETWLHALFLGTHAFEVGNVALAQKKMEMSNKLHPNAHATRALALLAPTQEESISFYEKAFLLASQSDLRESTHGSRQLVSDIVSEFSGWLNGNNQYDTLASFLNDIKTSNYSSLLDSKDRVLHARASLAVHKNDFNSAIEILRSNCFPTYSSLRSELINLWHEAQLQKAVSENGGEELSRLELLHLRRKFRCHGDLTDLTLKDDCVCGPPNLGYAYP